MKRLHLGLAVLPFLAGVASAAQPMPVSDAEMEAVTAGFAALSIADAQALGKIVTTFTATVAQVGPVTSTDPPVTISFGETVVAPLKSLPGSQWASTILTSLGNPFSR